MIMTESKKIPTEHDEQSISATARLPGLEIDLWHRRLPGETGEELTIRLRAVPSFEAFGRAMEGANPFALWVEMVRLAWSPWLMASQMMLGGGQLPRLTGRPSSE
jgi:hypothetical protein